MSNIEQFWIFVALLVLVFLIDLAWGHAEEWAAKRKGRKS
jgi:hypothetical protein